MTIPADSATVKQIRHCLTHAFSPKVLEIEDQSRFHQGHEGAKQGGGHYAVTIVAEAFAGKSLIERHKMVYGALGDLMKHEIHALQIKASD